MFLLDTNHCSALMRGEPAIHRRILELNETLVAISVIAVGELYYMAHRSERLTGNLAEVETFLARIPTYDVDGDVARVYGDIRAALFKRFGPKERAKRRHTTISQLGFDDNDLWVAAIAILHDLTVATDDDDFARIAEVTDLRHESWLTLSGAA
ncbi:MAG: type II toxin-antitoxin system VapC family toxin [Thermomicrobiales bacterium]